MRWIIATSGVARCRLNNHEDVVFASGCLTAGSADRGRHWLFGHGGGLAESCAIVSYRAAALTGPWFCTHGEFFYVLPRGDVRGAAPEPGSGDGWCVLPLHGLGDYNYLESERP